MGPAHHDELRCLHGFLLEHHLAFSSSQCQLLSWLVDHPSRHLIEALRIVHRLVDVLPHLIEALRIVHRLVDRLVDRTAPHLIEAKRIVHRLVMIASSPLKSARQLEVFALDALAFRLCIDRGRSGLVADSLSHAFAFALALAFASHGLLRLHPEVFRWAQHRACGRCALAFALLAFATFASLALLGGSSPPCLQSWLL